MSSKTCPQVMRLLTEAASTDQALINIAALDVDEVDVMVGLPVSTSSP